ncbi:MAG: porin family protein [bacterium]
MKRIAIILFFAISTTLLHAQQYPEYAIGIKGGATASYVYADPTISQYMPPVNYHAGTQFRMISEKHFGFIVELNYAQRGFSSYENGAYTNRRLDYIELPFLTHVTFGQKLCRFFFNLGPSISYMINDVQNITSTSEAHTLAVNKFDYGIAVDLGMEFNTNTGIYTFNIRYSYGLGNIFPSTSSDYYSMSSNQNISASIAYLFPLR